MSTNLYDPDAELERLYAAITGRPAFSYDPASDPVYNSYAQSYQRRGRLAMRNTMGQAAALTGGYGSSYAQSVGQHSAATRLDDATPRSYDIPAGSLGDLEFFAAWQSDQTTAVQSVLVNGQTAVPQAVVAFFLVQGLQKLPQFLHRERAGVHFQIQHTAVHRYPYRNFRRGGL